MDFSWWCVHFLENSTNVKSRIEFSISSNSLQNPIALKSSKIPYTSQLLIYILRFCYCWEEVNCILNIVVNDLKTHVCVSNLNVNILLFLFWWTSIMILVWSPTLIGRLLTRSVLTSSRTHLYSAVMSQASAEIKKNRKRLWNGEYHSQS